MRNDPHTYGSVHACFACFETLILLAEQFRMLHFVWAKHTVVRKGLLSEHIHSALEWQGAANFFSCWP